jgi:glycosyltransferase involved in cell wall biosynthesis
LRLVPNRFQKRLAEHRAKGGVVLGHFGSIYPKKHSEMVLEVASELQRRGHDVLAVCIGSFIKGQDRVEEDFRNKCRQLKLEERTVVTGYVDSPAELFAIFSEVDAFVYSFDEGLTSRRGSVLACLQSGKPVVVNAPKDPGEFDHHPAFGQAMSSGGLQFVAHGGDASGYAERIELLLQNPRASITFDFEACWQAANLVLQDALSGREPPLARQGTAYEPTSVSRGGAAGADRR